MANLNAWSCKNKISRKTRERNHIIDLILLKFKGFDNMLDLKFEEVDEEYFIVESNYNFV